MGKPVEGFLGHEDYPIETHEVETEDGYILTMIRIIGSKNYPKSDKESDVNDSKIQDKDLIKPAVIFTHGFVCSSEHWCMNPPDKVLPYRMTEDGYDCWIANLRGTPLSRGHRDIPKGSKKYWDFSAHEIGCFDVPAMVNYILDTTGNSNLIYIGHSMGCAVLFIAIDKMPEFCSKIKLFICLAPAVHGKNITNIYFRPLMPICNILSKSKFIRTRELLGSTCTGIAKTVYFGRKNSQNNIEKFGAWLYQAFGYRYGFASKAEPTDEETQERMKRFAEVFPRPTSFKLFCHGMQMWNSGKLGPFNYGHRENLKRYGVAKIPLYNFQKANLPVLIIYSDYDRLCTPKDIETLAKSLPNVIEFHKVCYPEFSHIDFIFSTTANKHVYDKIYEVLRKTGDSPVKKIQVKLNPE